MILEALRTTSIIFPVIFMAGFKSPTVYNCLGHAKFHLLVALIKVSL